MLFSPLFLLAIVVTCAAAQEQDRCCCIYNEARPCLPGFPRASCLEHSGFRCREPSNPSPNKFRTIVVGGGMAGRTFMYELTRKGIGSPQKAGPSGATGILLLEKYEKRVCGIAEPIYFPESSGLDQSPFSEDYKPFAMTTHAMRVNIQTMSPMRCLAHELRIPLYFSPWATEYRNNGYKALHSRTLCKRDAVLSDGFSGTCRASCKADGPNPVFGDGSCEGDWGSAELVKQTTSSAEGAPYNLWNYDPANGANQGDYDPEDEWYSWAIGYSNYYNPTYSRVTGKTYNDASPFPFNPDTPEQDHPRHRCKDFADVYSMYQYYLGPDYASFICTSNYGFRGDCFNFVDPCVYVGSATETGWLFESWQEVDEGYPVGSMAQFCIRQQYLAEHNDNGVPASFVNGEEVTAVWDHTPQHPGYNAAYASSRYVVHTSSRVLYADEVVLATEPTAVEKLAGNVPAAIVAQPEFQSAVPIGCVTIELDWAPEDREWLHKIQKNTHGSYRMLHPGSCINRIEFLNVPTHLHMGAVRVTYNCEAECTTNLVGLAKITDPTLQAYNADTGFPLDSRLVEEQMRELNQLFRGGGPYSFFSIPEIPAPRKAIFNYEPYSWFYLKHTKAGGSFRMDHVLDWATHPLGDSQPVALAHQAWAMLYAGWMMGPLASARLATRRLYPAEFTEADYNERFYCQADWGTNKADPEWEVPCTPGKFPWEAPCTTSYDYSTPGLGLQYSYAHGLPNEHFPPYADDTPIQWQGPEPQ